MKVHYGDPSPTRWRAACGWHVTTSTPDKSKVTCQRCKSTRRWLLNWYA